MDDNEATISMGAKEPKPAAKKKKKAGASEENKTKAHVKDKKKDSIPKLQDVIRENRNEVPNLETGPRVGDSVF